MMGIWVDLSVDCFLQKSSIPLIFFNFELEHDYGPGFTTVLALSVLVISLVNGSGGIDP